MGEPRSLDKAEANGGYSWLGNSLVDNYLHLFSGLGSKVYIYLVRHTFQTDSNQITKPLSASEIGNALSRTPRSISKALKELMDLGVIEIIKSPGKASRYQLLETYEENFSGGRKKTSQGTEENFTPPEKKTSQDDAANQRGARAGGPPKSNKNRLRTYRRVRFTKRHQGMAPVKMAKKTGKMRPEEAL